MEIRDDLEAERDLRLSSSEAHASAAVVKSVASVLSLDAGLSAAQEFLESVAAARRLLIAEALPDEAASGI